MTRPQPQRAGSERDLELRVRFDMRGYATGQHDYLWIGDDEPGSGCYTHTTSLRSLRKLHQLLAAMIAKRERRNSQRQARARIGNKR